MRAQIPSVPVGTTSKAGYGVTAFALASAVVAYATGDHSQQTTGVIMAGTVAALSFLVTQAGRYLQAHALIAQGHVTVQDDDPLVRLAAIIAARGGVASSVVGVGPSLAGGGRGGGGGSAMTQTREADDEPGDPDAAPSLPTSILPPDHVDEGDVGGVA